MIANAWKLPSLKICPTPFVALCFWLPLPSPMKKCIAFLWLIVSILATFFPCCTKDDCCADTTGLQQPLGQNRKSDKACSPFLTCGTCVGFAQTAKTIEIPSFTLQKLVHQARIIVHAPSSYKASPFQPPRMVWPSPPVKPTRFFINSPFHEAATSMCCPAWLYRPFCAAYNQIIDSEQPK